MRVLVVALIFFVSTPTALAQERLVLKNDPWPPFVVEGDGVGTSEALVCEALTRAGWPCEVEILDWNSVLYGSKDGSVSGIAAVWHTDERASFLLYSRPYLTNRIVAVTSRNANRDIKSLADLEGLSVALSSGYAYGDEIQAARMTFRAMEVDGEEAAIEAVRNGEADVALTDELLARDLVGSTDSAIRVSDGHLLYRELYFAMSRLHPQAGEIVSAFNQSYEEMLKDGSVNEILDVDWLATDLDDDGTMDMVLRSSASLDSLANPAVQGTAYALGQDDYRMMSDVQREDATVNYRVEGESHDNVQSALGSAFSRDARCSDDGWGRPTNCQVPIKTW